MLKQVKRLVELEKRFCASEADPYGTDASSVRVASDPELYELMSNITTYFDDDTDVTKHEATNTKLLGPSRLANLPTQSYRQLQAWRDANAPEVPTECVRPRVLKMARCVLANGDTVRSLEMLRSNATRSASLIQHLYEGANGELKREFSEVLYFFTPDWEDSNYQLASVRTFPVQSEGRLLYRTGRGYHQIIQTDDIEELLGFVISKGREYLISQYHPYLSARVL